MSLHSVNVDCVADVSEEHVAPVVRVETCRVGEFKWICRFMFQKNHGRGSWCPIQAYEDSKANAVKGNIRLKGRGKYVQIISS